MLWGENRGKWKGRQLPGVEPRTPLAWAASALPLSHDSRTTTNPHNPLCVLHRWYWMPQSHTWQPLSMCYQNSVRGWPENSLHQERIASSWGHSQILSRSFLHSCEIKSGSGLGMRLRKEPCWVVFLTLIDSRRLPAFHFPLFSPHIIQIHFYFQREARCSHHGRTYVCYPMYTSSYASIWWKLSGSELDNSQQMAVYKLMFVG